MTIASKSGGLILKEGALATNCGCCTCPYPQLPDSIEIDISRNESTYVTHVNNTFATGLLKTFPEGVFTLDPVGTIDQTAAFQRYLYTNSINGARELSAEFRQENGIVTVSVECVVSLCRQKTFADTQTPPTEEELAADDWTDDSELASTHPPYNAGFANIFVRKSSWGTGAANIVNYELRLTDVCSSSTTTRGLEFFRITASQSIKACLEPGCVFPASISAGSLLDIPHTTGVAMPGALAVREKCSGIINSVSLIYNNSQQPMFSALGTGACSGEAGDLTSLGVVLDEC
jgi:hypothetical protein